MAFTDATMSTRTGTSVPQHWRARPARKLSRSRYDIELSTDIERLAGLWPDAETTADRTVFQAWATFSAWVRHVAPVNGATWFVALVIDPETRTPKLLLPLIRRRVGTITVIEAADLGVADFNAPVLDTAFTPSQAEMAAIWHDLKDRLPHADLIRLSKLPATIGTHPNPLLLLPGVHPMTLSNYKTRLAVAGAPWTPDCLPEPVRTDLETRRRKLMKRGTLRFHTAASEADANRFFAAMVEQRAVRCRATGRDNILDCEHYRAFYRELIDPADATAIGCIQALTLDDEIIATGYGLILNGAFHMIFPTFRAERWRNYSPGLQLFTASMTWAAERGLTEYDFTIGDERFKTDLGAGQYPLYEHLTALTARGKPAVYDDTIRRFVRTHPRLHAVVKRLRQPPPKSSAVRNHSQ
jgi:CelD/BcsL family acetyltransferase involved in cellulose biosynthesis